MQGLNPLNEQYQQQYGPGRYIPNVFIQYWSMRVMAYLGALVSLFALWGAWLIHRRHARDVEVVPLGRRRGRSSPRS